METASERSLDMAKVTWGGGALIAPVPPVLVSCGTMEHPNVLTIGWTGILNTIPPKTYISVRPERFSYPLIKENGCFVINLPTSRLVRAVDFCGVRSGRDMNKFEVCKLTPVAATKIDCPMVAESPLSLECKVTDEIALGSHHMFMADIVAVNVEEALLDSAGKLHLDKANLLAYAHGEYFELGKKVGSFGYSVRKKPITKGRPAYKGKSKKK